MKRMLCAITLMLVSAMVYAQTSQNPSSSGQNMPNMSSSGQNMPSSQSGSADEQQLLGLEQQWADAMKSGDMNALSRIEADGYVFTDPSGKITGKQDDVNGIKSGQTKFQSFELSGLQAHVYGDTGVVTGQAKLKGTENGQDISGTYIFTDTFARRNGQWQAVSTQSAKAPGSQMPQ